MFNFKILIFVYYFIKINYLIEVVVLSIKLSILFKLFAN